MKKITLDEGTKEKLAKASANLVGAASGMAAGVVIKSALEMVVPMPMKPATMLGFKAGKIVLAAVATAAVERGVATEIERTISEAREVMYEVKEMVGRNNKCLPEAEENDS